MTTTDYTFRHDAVDLLSEAASEELVDLYRRDGTPLPRISEAEARERRAFLEHMAYLLDAEDWTELGRELGPRMKRHINECIEAAAEHRRREAFREVTRPHLVQSEET